jgi:hypothetical protein
MAGVWTHPEIFGELTLVGGPDIYSGSYTMLCEGSERPRGFVRQLKRTSVGNFAAAFGDGICEGKLEGVTLSEDGKSLHAEVLWDKRSSGPVSSTVILQRLR